MKQIVFKTTIFVKIMFCFYLLLLGFMWYSAYVRNHITESYIGAISFVICLVIGLAYWNAKQEISYNEDVIKVTSFALWRKPKITCVQVCTIERISCFSNKGGDSFHFITYEGTKHLSIKRGNKEFDDFIEKIKKILPKKAENQKKDDKKNFYLKCYFVALILLVISCGALILSPSFFPWLLALIVLEGIAMIVFLILSAKTYY